MDPDDVAPTIAEVLVAWRKCREALRACEDYLDQRADADMKGDPPRYVPNEEMRLLTLVQRALGEDV